MSDNGLTPEWINLIGTAAVPLLVLVFSGIGGIVGWFVKSRFETSQRRAERLEQEVRDYQLEIYNEIPNPFILLLVPGATSEELTRSVSENAVSKLLMDSLQVVTFCK
ncbi:MAG: hypothetical protein OXC09_03975 [Truepera sp.]|nr:hypothetical protein [Truepera sp.]